MDRDPTHRTITDWQAQLLADLFRFILKEIKSDEDKEKLAPGELGINYKEGTFYVRNPHTGELFAPNSMEHVKHILKKYDIHSNILNADKVGDVTIYSRLGQLDKLTIEFTPDSVLRQMHSPGIFFGAIKYENFESLGWPSNDGMCLAYKISDECAIIRYYDNRTYTLFEGKYNYILHLFEGWGLSGSGDSIYAESVGTSESLMINTKEELRDLMVLAVRLTEPLYAGSTITVNDYGPLPIVKLDHTPMDTNLSANTTIMLIYDERSDEWILFDSTDSVMLVTLAITNQRFFELEERMANETSAIREDYTEKIRLLTKKHNEDMEEAEQYFLDTLDEAMRVADVNLTHAVYTLNQTINQRASEPGNIQTVVSVCNVASGPIRHIPLIEGFDSQYDKLMVNYGQTILRPELDYTIVGDGITFSEGLEFTKDDVIQFIVFKQRKI